MSITSSIGAVSLRDAAIWRMRRGTLPLERPLVVGIVNLTPDSFSDGGVRAAARAPGAGEAARPRGRSGAGDAACGARGGVIGCRRSPPRDNVTA